MVLYVHGIVQQINAEIKIAKILVELLMLLVRLKELDAQLELVENALEYKIVSKLK